MTDDDLRKIETRLAADRDALARTLDRLGDGLAPQTLRAEAAQAALSCGSGLGGTLWQAARRNPAGAVLAGAGLALLVAGSGGPGRQPEMSDRRDPAARPRRDASARRLHAALHSGLEGLPPEARRRILEARLAALHAQEAVEQDARRPATRAAGAISAHPVAAATAALGLGALAAALVPRNGGRKAGLARRRDDLMDQARAALARERAIHPDTVATPAGANGAGATTRQRTR